MRVLRARARRGDRRRCLGRRTLAFLDSRQFHAGHMLVIPRQHLSEVRELDHATGAALMTSVTRITRAVAAAVLNQGLSLWHSIGEAAD